jgi:hypothetical protein
VNFARHLADAGAIEMVHTERAQPAALADGDHEIHGRQAAAERALHDGRRET